jgi:hypothetical protein
MGAKKRQTFGKMTRERALKEKRALKQERKDGKKQAAADARKARLVETPGAPDLAGDEPADAAPEADPPRVGSAPDLA